MYFCEANKCNGFLKKEAEVYRCPKCNSVFSISWIKKKNYKIRRFRYDKKNKTATDGYTNEKKSEKRTD